MTSRELMLSTLEFRNTQERVPRQLSVLPWGQTRYPEQVKKLREDFVWDAGGPAVRYAQPTIAKGDAFAVGEYIDDWGCKFINIHDGVIGEVKEPQVQDDDWEDADKVHIPEELLSFDIAQVNADCAEKNDKFLLSPILARPFEQLQFIRGTVGLYMDLMDPPAKLLSFMEKMHDFYCRTFTKWAQTDVDALYFMDDWGAQNDLLIPPAVWDEYFLPMYRDYIDIAHKHGKKAFMHSDGQILRIIPKLIDAGLDIINAQIFCIGIENLRPYRGKITFWGEMDRQYLLPYGTTEEIDEAVQKVYDNLWDNGGCVAACEFGPGAKPENVRRIFEKWSTVR